MTHPTHDANLTSLDLYNQNLGRVPKAVWKHAGLERLNLAENGLTSISEEIGKLVHLRMLDLGHNQLRSVPEPVVSAWSGMKSTLRANALFASS